MNNYQKSVLENILPLSEKSVVSFRIPIIFRIPNHKTLKFIMEIYHAPFEFQNSISNLCTMAILCPTRYGIREFIMTCGIAIEDY